MGPLPSARTPLAARLPVRISRITKRLRLTKRADQQMRLQTLLRLALIRRQIGLLARARLPRPNRPPTRPGVHLPPPTR
jgi:hypothetical protein